MLSPWFKYVRREEVGRSILDKILFNIMLNLANFIGVSVYLWSVDEKNHFLQTNIQKTPSEKD